MFVLSIERHITDYVSDREANKQASQQVNQQTNTKQMSRLVRNQQIHYHTHTSISQGIIS